MERSASAVEEGGAAAGASVGARAAHIKVQHSIILTTKSSRVVSGSLPYVLQRCVRPKYRSPSNHNPNLPLK